MIERSDHDGIFWVGTYGDEMVQSTLKISELE